MNFLVAFYFLPSSEFLALRSNIGSSHLLLIKLPAIAARGGMETLRPALQRVYMTRASAYRDALKSFIEGYQEGVQQVMEKKDSSKTQQDSDTPKTSANH